jgi:hypothetical protein
MKTSNLCMPRGVYENTIGDNNLMGSGTCPEHLVRLHIEGTAQSLARGKVH